MDTFYTEQLDIGKFFEMSYVSGPFGDKLYKIAAADCNQIPSREDYRAIGKMMPVEQKQTNQPFQVYIKSMTRSIHYISWYYHAL